MTIVVSYPTRMLSSSDAIVIEPIKLIITHNVVV